MYGIKILYLVKELRKEPLFLTLTQATDFRQSHTKRVCRQQFQIGGNGRNSAQMDRHELLLKKGEVARYEQLLLFSPCLQKT